jgi:hypothetical protein
MIMTDAAPQIDMNRLEDALARGPRAIQGGTLLDPVKQAAQHHSYAQQRPLDSIASAIKRLNWDDNEHLAELIDKHKDSGSTAKAVQSAANDLLVEGSEPK